MTSPASNLSSRVRSASWASISDGTPANSSTPRRNAVFSMRVSVSSIGCSGGGGERETGPRGGLADQRVHGGEIDFDQRHQSLLLALADHEQRAGSQPGIVGLQQRGQGILETPGAEP